MLDTGRRAVTGKGSREEVSPGVWRVRHNLGRDPITGSYLYSPWRTIHTTAPTRKGQLRQVEDFADEYRRELNERGVAPAPATMTVGKYLDAYHAGRYGTVRRSTYDREAQRIKKAKAMLGRHRLGEVTPPILRAVYANAIAEGTISHSEVYEVNKLLRRAFRQGVEDGMLASNPAERVKIPMPRYKEREILTAEQAARFRSLLLAEPTSPCSVATLILLETGCRRGEALGLQWKHVSTRDRRIAICQQLTKELELEPPKSAMSNRIISISDATAEWLAAWRDDQRRLFEEVGAAWDEETPVVHAFTAELFPDGEGRALLPRATFVQPRNFARWFRDFCVDNGFGRYTKNLREATRAGGPIVRGGGYVGISPHSLRHTQSTLLIGGGVDVKTVQARLGHSSPTLTLRQYTRALTQNDVAAASRFDEILDSAGS